MSEKGEQQEFEGWISTKVKEIRLCAKKLFDVRDKIDLEKSKFKQNVLKPLQDQEEELVHDMAVLMVKHKLDACAAGPYRIIRNQEEKITVEKGVDADDQLKNKTLTDPGNN